MSLAQYGDTNTAEFTWKNQQSKSNLLKLVDSIPSRVSAAPALGSHQQTIMHTHIKADAHTHCGLMSAGSALRFALQTSLSPASGGRVGVPKAVVMLVTDKSTDDIKEAANEALAAGKL